MGRGRRLWPWRFLVPPTLPPLPALVIDNRTDGYTRAIRAADCVSGLSAAGTRGPTRGPRRRDSVSRRRAARSRRPPHGFDRCRRGIRRRVADAVHVRQEAAPRWPVEVAAGAGKRAVGCALGAEQRRARGAAGAVPGLPVLRREHGARMAARRPRLPGGRRAASRGDPVVEWRLG